MSFYRAKFLFILLALYSAWVFAGSLDVASSGKSVSQTVAVRATVREISSLTLSRGGSSSLRMHFAIQLTQPGVPQEEFSIGLSQRDLGWSLFLDKAENEQDRFSLTPLGQYSLTPHQGQPPAPCQIGEQELLVITLSSL